LKNFDKNFETSSFSAGIIGFGSISKKHIQTLSEMLPKTKFIVKTAQIISETDPINELDIQFTSKFETFLSAKQDITIIATAATNHKKDFQKIVSSFENILIEKPIASCMEDAKEIKRLSEKLNKNVSIGYNLRHTAGAQKVRALIKNSDIGEPISFSMTVGQCIEAWRPDRDYRFTVSAQKSLGGGVLRELSHELDLALLFFGQPSVLESKLYKAVYKDLDVEDTAQIRAKFSGLSDIIGTINMDFTRPKKVRNVIVNFSAGSIHWDLLDGKIVKETQSKTEILLDTPDDINNSYKKMFQSIISRDKSHLCNIDEAIATIQLIECIEKNSPSESV